MALLGIKKKQAFGQIFDPLSNGPYGTPGIGDGINQQMGAPVQGMGQLPDIANMPDMGGMQDQQPAKFKPNLLGVIGDAMQVFGGGQATYMNGVREQQERSEMMRQRALQAQQERQTKWQDYVREAEYDRANPAPKAPDKLTQYMINAGIDPASDKAKQIFAAAVTNEAYPERAVPYTDEQGNSGLRFIRSGMPPQQGAPVFAGWADDEEGGQTQPVSGNFPPKPIRRNNSGY